MKRILVSSLTVISIGMIIIFICYVDNTKAAVTTLADVVIAKAGSCTSWQSGFRGVCKTNNHEYRYIGANVNNYVKFNNDLYRIIGVFDSNSTGVTGNLVKLIRARSIGGYSWGVTNESPDYTTYLTYNNNWETANANILLNEYFLNYTNTSTTYKSCYGWTYYFYANDNDYKTKDCSNVVVHGIRTQSLRNYIQPVTWYLNGFDSASYSKSDFYNCERGQTTGDVTKDGNCNSGNNGSYSATIANKSIGLIYVSDYLYASGFYANDNTLIATQNHARQNWLFNSYELTITPLSNTDKRTFFVSTSHVSTSNSYYPYNLRPTFYLKEDVYVTGGNGSFHNPYTIACDNCDS